MHYVVTCVKQEGVVDGTRIYKISQT